MSESINSTLQEDVAVYVDPKHRSLAALGIFLSMFSNIFCYGSISIIMPALVAKVGGMELYSLVFTLTTLATVIFGPLAGRLGSIYDKGRVIILGTIFNIIGNVATAFAPTMPIVLALRLIASGGGAFATVLGLTIIGLIFPSAQRMKWIGYYGTLMAGSNVVAPILAGFLSDSIGWEWVFYLTVPISIVAILMIARYLPKMPVSSVAGSVDFGGLVVFTLIMAAVIVLCQIGGQAFPWISVQTFGFVLAICVLLFIFVKVEKKQGGAAMIPMNLFQFPTFRVAVICAIVLTMASLATYVYLALYMQNIMGISATMSGLPVMVQSLVAVVLSPVLGQYIAKTRRIKSTAILCCILYSAPLFFYSMLTPSTPLAVILAVQLIYGIGATIHMTIFTMAVQVGVPPEHLGPATATVQSAMSIGSTIGTPILTAVFATATMDISIPWVFRTAAIFAAISILPALMLKSQKK